MAQTSKRAKALRRMKRENSKLRKTVQILPGLMQEQLNRAYGELLPLIYALLAEQGDSVVIRHSTMEDIRANGPKMKYTAQPGDMDETNTVIHLVRPAVTITPIPDEAPVEPSTTINYDDCVKGLQEEFQPGGIWDQKDEPTPVAVSDESK